MDYVKILGYDLEDIHRELLQCKRIVSVSVQNKVIADELNFHLDYALSRFEEIDHEHFTKA